MLHHQSYHLPLILIGCGHSFSGETWIEEHCEVDLMSNIRMKRGMQLFDDHIHDCFEMKLVPQVCEEFAVAPSLMNVPLQLNLLKNLRKQDAMRSPSILRA